MERWINAAMIGITAAMIGGYVIALVGIVAWPGVVWLVGREAAKYSLMIIPLTIASVGVIAMAKSLRSARERAFRIAGRCVKCGYDLCKTPDRCPECGTMPRHRVSRIIE